MLLLFVSLLLPLLTSCCSITVQPPTLIQHSNRKGNNKKNKRRDGERERKLQLTTLQRFPSFSYLFSYFFFFFFSLQGSLTESAHGGTITSHDQVLVGPGSPTPGYWQLGNSIFNSSRFPPSSFSPLFASALLLSLHFSPSFTLSLT